MFPIEVCIDTPAGLDACVAGGADRIELCSALGLGGLTPSAGLMSAAAACSVPAHAMIRPTDGGFVVSDVIMQVMLDDIAAARAAGLAGVVFGALTTAHVLDHAKLSALITAAGPLEVTLHRAIDLCVDPAAAVDEAVTLGFTRILSSGGAMSALSGAEVLAAMVARAAGRISIMAGSGVTADNVASLVKTTGVDAVHASCASGIDEDQKIAAFGFGPAQKRRTDPIKIKALRQALAG